jgi:hypothetical protein
MSMANPKVFHGKLNREDARKHFLSSRQGPAG